MSKPSAPKNIAVAGWIVAVLVIAGVGLLASGNAGLRAHSPNAASVALPLGEASLGKTVTPALRDRVRAEYTTLPLAFEANEGQADPQVRYLARGEGYQLSLTSSRAIMTLAGVRRPSEVYEMMLNKREGTAHVRSLMKKRALSSVKESSVAVLQMDLGRTPHAQLAAEDLQPGKVNYFLGRDRSKWHTNIATYGRVSYRDVYPGVDLAFHGAGQRLEFDYLVRPGADASPITLSFQGADGMHLDDAGDLVLATSAGPVRLHKPVAYQPKNGARNAVQASFALLGKNRVAFALGPYDHTRDLVIDPTVTYSTYFAGSAGNQPGASYGIAIAVNASGDAFVAGAFNSLTIPGPSGTVAGINNGGQGDNGSFDSFVTEISPTGSCIFTSVFGGSADDFAGAIAVDSAGIYVSGTTDSSDFPATVGQISYTAGAGANGDNAAYAVKFDLTGNLANGWATYIEGTDSTSGSGIAVDTSHNLYVVGETYANDLGGATGGVNALPNGSALNLGQNTDADDGYIVKLSADGTTYLLVSFIGGSYLDLATGVALDGNGNIYVSGFTVSTDLPVTPGVVQNKCGTDGNCNGTSEMNRKDDFFVAGIKADLSGYVYLTYYGGSGVDDALAVTANTSGNAFLTGNTTSTDFPLETTPYQGSLAGTQNAAVVELNSTGSQAAHSTYFGGNGTDYGYSVVLDSSENVYLTGQTSSSSKFPLSANATQPALSGPTDAFVSALNLSSDTLLFSTYLGGSGDEDQFAGGIGLDGSQNVYVTGDTDSGNGTTTAFPTTSALDGTYGGGTCLNSGGSSVPCPDAFIAAYSPATAPDFGIAATAPAAVNPGSSGTSTVTLTSVNGYSLAVNMSCSVSGSGSPAPSCGTRAFSTNPLTPTSGGAQTMLTINTTGMSAALHHSSSLFYAVWLPVIGLSLLGMSFNPSGARRRRMLGLLLLGVVMALLFLLPACSSSSGGGGGGGCTGCTPAGSYTVTITGTDTNNLSHSTQVTLTVN